METKNQWKIVGASVAVAGFGVGGLLGAVPDDPEPSNADAITLRDTSVVNTTPRASLDSPVDHRDVSPRQASVDSPVRSPNNSPADTASVDSPEPAPPAPPAPSAPPAPPPPPTTAHIPAHASVDSPAPAGVDSAASASVDSPS